MLAPSCLRSAHQWERSRLWRCLAPVQTCMARFRGHSRSERLQVAVTYLALLSRNTPLEDMESWWVMPSKLTSPSHLGLSTFCFRVNLQNLRQKIAGVQDCELSHGLVVNLHHFPCVGAGQLYWSLDRTTIVDTPSLPISLSFITFITLQTQTCQILRKRVNMVKIEWNVREKQWSLNETSLKHDEISWNIMRHNETQWKCRPCHFRQRTRYPFLWPSMKVIWKSYESHMKIIWKSYESHMKVVRSKLFSNANWLEVIGFWPCRPPSQTTLSAGPLQCLRQYQPQLILNDLEKNNYWYLLTLTNI